MAGMRRSTLSGVPDRTNRRMPGRSAPRWPAVLAAAALAAVLGPPPLPRSRRPPRRPGARRGRARSRSRARSRGRVRGRGARDLSVDPARACRAAPVRARPAHLLRAPGRPAGLLLRREPAHPGQLPLAAGQGRGAGRDDPRGGGRPRLRLDRQRGELPADDRAASADPQPAARRPARHGHFHGDQLPGAGAGRLAAVRAALQPAGRRVRRQAQPRMALPARRRLGARVRGLQHGIFRQGRRPGAPRAAAAPGRPLRRLLRQLVRADIRVPVPGHAAVGHAGLHLPGARARPVVYDHGHYRPPGFRRRLPAIGGMRRGRRRHRVGPDLRAGWPGWPAPRSAARRPRPTAPAAG